MLNLSVILLQVGIFNWFRGTGTGEISVINQLLIPAIVAGVIGFIVYKLIRARSVRNSYPPGHGSAMGFMDIEIQEGKSLEGFVRRYDLPHLESTKLILKKIPYMEKVLPEIEKLERKKQLGIYEMRLNDIAGLKDLTSHGQDIMIISIGHLLESDEVSYEHILQKVGMFSTGNERKKKILCAATSRFHDIMTPDGIKDVYVVSPFPKPDKEAIREFGLRGNDIHIKDSKIANPLYLSVNTVADTESFARVVMYMEAVTIAEREIEQKTRRIDELMELNSTLQDKIIEFQRREDVYRMRLGEQKLIGFTTPPFLPFRGEPWAWHIVFAVAPLAGFILTPTFTRAIPDWLGAAFALGIMVGIRFMSLRGQRKAEEDEISQAMT